MMAGMVFFDGRPHGASLQVVQSLCQGLDFESVLLDPGRQPTERRSPRARSLRSFQA